MEVSPSALEFKGSFTKPTSEYLSLTNTSNTPLAFKVKTTAPKLYCVRPNASIIEPGNSIKISIILQGFSQPLPEDYKCKDKFLLVSLPCPDLDDASKLSDYWPSLEAKYKQQLVQKKLRVNYVIGEDVEDNVAGGNGVDSQREFQPQQDDSGFGSGAAGSDVGGSGAGAGALGAGAVGAGAVGAGAAYAGSHSNTYGDDVPEDVGANVNRSVNDSFAPNASNNGYASGANYNSTSEAAGIAAASRVDKSQPSADYQRDLEDSNAKINNLSDKFDSNEKRTQDSSDYTSQAQASSTEEPSSGISLPLAILLMLIAFLIGVLVF
mmetsp:Transcript_4194/g.4145  ORF Transcript_4194/g.4145 Transcript_4194/m.4145 type:complete len:323 (+) Transcript_4194:451-1419(+)